MAKIKLTPRAEHLLNEIAAGRNRVFYMTDMPVGWVYLERAGLAVRDDSRAILTEKGKLFLDSK